MATPADQFFDFTGSFGNGSVTIGGVTYFNIDAAQPISAGNGMLSLGGAASGDQTTIGFKSADGSEFYVAALTFFAVSGGNYVFEGYHDGVLINSISGAVPSNSLNSAGLYFPNVDEVRVIAPGNGAVQLDTVDFEPAVPTHVAPVINDLKDDSVSYAEGALPVLIDQSANATISDSDTFVYPGGLLSFSFGTAYKAGDILGIRTGSGVTLSDGVTLLSTVFVGSTAIGYITGEGVSGGPLQISLNGNANAANVSTLLQNITFSNSDGDNPPTGSRQIITAFDDGDTDSAIVSVTSTVTVARVNDAPVVTTSTGAVSYTEGTPVAVDSALVISDVDTTTISYATVEITEGYRDGDMLSAVGGGGIAVIDSGTRTLTIAGLGTLSQYMSLFRTIQFSTGDNPGTGDRTISFQVRDTTLAWSEAATREIHVTPVNDAPSATVSGAVNYMEGLGAVAVASNIVLSDPDSTTLSFVKVAITGSFQAGADVLSFTGAAGITGSYNAATGELLLTGTATLATYQTVLRSVTFNNASENPGATATARSVTITANDGSVSQVVATRIVNVEPENDKPSEITLSSAVIAENSANGAVIGALAASDPDNATTTLSLEDSAGGRFAIQNGNLVVANGGLLNFEDNGSHSVTVRASDAGGLFLDKTFTITVSNVNEAPTVLTLSSFNVAENTATGSVVGTFSRLDPDVSDPATYSLVSNPGNHFVVVGNQLVVLAGTLDHEIDATHAITVRVTDKGGLTHDQGFTITVRDVNEAPTAMALSNASILENSANGTTVGMLTSTDQDNGDTAAYTLLDNAGGRFAINGDKIVVANSALLDFEAAKSHSVTVRTTDKGGLTFDETFAISVGDINEAPIAGADVALTPIVVNSGPRTITEAELLANASDPDGNTLHVTGLKIATGVGTLINNQNSTWTFTPVLNSDKPIAFDFGITDGQSTVAGHASLGIDQAQSAPELGTVGDDTFIAATGNASYIGGLGSDLIAFDFKLTEAKVTYSGNQIIIDGPTSHTVTNGIEIFRFTDGTANNDDADRMVDDLFYYSQNLDVWKSGADADAHYHSTGWKKGFDPSAFFSTSTYQSLYREAAGTDPLAHYNTVGAKKGYAPSIDFDPAAYLKANGDVKAAGVDPLAHFMQFGAQEGRTPTPFDHLLTGDGFDYAFYLRNNPDVAAAHVDPLVHFKTLGWKEGRDPNAYFDTDGYLAAYADVAKAGINPLDHYNAMGWKEGRDPSLGFDTSSYLAANADVAAAKVNPLLHFLNFGIDEGRHAFSDTSWV